MREDATSHVSLRLFVPHTFEFLGETVGKKAVLGIINRSSRLHIVRIGDPELVGVDTRWRMIWTYDPPIKVVQSSLC